MNLVPGTFKAKGVTGGLGETKNGAPQIAVLLQIHDEEYAGETITWYGYFTEKTKERTLEALRILGWKTDDLSDLAGIDENEVRVVLKEEEYNGEVSLKVAFINRAGGLALQAPMTPDKAKAFAASMKGAAVLSRSATPQRKPTTQAKPQQPTTGSGRQITNQSPPDDFGGTDDQIPF